MFDKGRGLGERPAVAVEQGSPAQGSSRLGKLTPEMAWLLADCRRRGVSRMNVLHWAVVSVGAFLAGVGLALLIQMAAAVLK